MCIYIYIERCLFFGNPDPDLAPYPLPEVSSRKEVEACGFEVQGVVSGLGSRDWGPAFRMRL